MGRGTGDGLLAGAVGGKDAGRGGAAATPWSNIVSNADLAGPFAGFFSIVMYPSKCARMSSMSLCGLMKT
jgi:hypothetical protein